MTAPSDGPGEPTTSLIISTRNRPAFLSTVVASILAGSRTPEELVIVDQSDAAHPELPKLAREARPTRIVYLWQPDRGLSRGRNTGIAAAHGQILAFVDDDVVVPREWFTALVGSLVGADPRSVVTGRVVAGNEESPGAFAPSLSLSETSVVYRGRVGRDVLQPQNMAMFRSVIAEIGGFDERLGVGSHFPSSEDNDFGYRLLEAGYQIVYDPHVVVAHRAWRRPTALLPLRWGYGRGQGAYFAKHLSLRDRYMLRRLWWDMSRHVRRAPRRTLRNPRNGIADLVYALGVLAGEVEWLATQRRRR